MLTVGDTLPSFNLKALVSLEPDKEFCDISSSMYAGKWLVLFYWPLSFSKEFPPELLDFGRHYEEFIERGADVLAASTDAPYIHLAWRKEHPALKDLPFPTLADFKRELARKLGVVSKHDGTPLRATFLIGPDRTIRWACAYDLGFERTAGEVLRVLDGLAPASRGRYSMPEAAAKPPRSKQIILLEATG
ncbi:MAG TPA: redoxin domain-containing protein [Polyangiaceae bacterium]|jgi:peroxiredoxin (alkyl hydroperoxide reductase subunit C)|nr:redoxin domain-containing protein [Polyangiaceae bacterium]